MICRHCKDVKKIKITSPKIDVQKIEKRERPFVWSDGYNFSSIILSTPFICYFLMQCFPTWVSGKTVGFLENPQISSIGRLLLGPSLVCLIEGQRIHYNCHDSDL